MGKVLSLREVVSPGYRVYRRLRGAARLRNRRRAMIPRQSNRDNLDRLGKIILYAQLALTYRHFFNWLINCIGYSLDPANVTE